MKSLPLLQVRDHPAFIKAVIALNASVEAWREDPSIYTGEPITSGEAVKLPVKALKLSNESLEYLESLEIATVGDLIRTLASIAKAVVSSDHNN